MLINPLARIISLIACLLVLVVLLDDWITIKLRGLTMRKRINNDKEE